MFGPELDSPGNLCQGNEACLYGTCIMPDGNSEEGGRFG